MHNRLTDAPNHSVEGRHSKAGGFVHEGDGRRTDNTESQWKEEAHKKDHERVEAAKLMLAKRQKSNEGGADVNAN